MNPKDTGDISLGTEPASWTHHVRRSVLQDALAMSAGPDIISFSLGLPAPELFPVKAFEEACAHVLKVNRSALQYGPQSVELKAHIVALMRKRSVECTERQIFLTNGAQQAVNLLVALLLDPGRQIIAEDLCYPGFQQTVRFYNPEVLTVSSDCESGMDVDQVEWHLKHTRPSFIYAIPSGHNPLASSLSREKRTRLLSLSESYAVPIIEEDPYGFLSYVKESAPPLRAHSDEQVLYVGSFSKILAPSVRVGWIIVPERFIPHLAILKESSDIDTATFSQHVVARMLDSGFLPGHLDRLCSEYGRRRDAMLKAVSQHFPGNSKWVRPDCGVYVWVQLPHGMNTTSMLEVAVHEHNVAFMPGAAFCFPGVKAENCLRLNFSHPSVAKIEEGMMRLGEVFNFRCCQQREARA